MAEHRGESKKGEEEEEPFIILGGSKAEKEGQQKEEKKEHHAESEKKEYVIDFSGAKGLFEGKHSKIFGKVSVYIILLIILLITAQLRLLPINSYPKEAPLASADPWWQYRHANEIYELGYPGQALKETSSTMSCPSPLFCLLSGGKIYWDYLHDAPSGAPAPIEFYQYFVAHSYKYFGKSFFPSLIEYMKFTPVLFGVLAVLSMFLLVREIFGNKSALMAAFIFALSQSYLQRSVVGHADTDSIVVFLSIFTVFMFFAALKRKSFLWAGAAGVTLGIFGFTWPGGYTATAIILIIGAVVYYLIRIPSTLFLRKSANTFKELMKEEWRGLAIIAIFLIIGLGIVAVIESPYHANLLRSFEGFLQLRSIQRAPLTAGGEVIRNVFLTVAEFNPTSSRIITFSIHIAIYILAAFSVFTLSIWAYKNLKEEKSHIAIYFVPFLLLWIGSTYYASLNAIRFIETFSIPMAILASVMIGTGDYLSIFNVKKSRQILATIILAFLVILILVGVPNISPQKETNQVGVPYIQTSIGIAERSGGGEGGNWLEFYKWARENTPEGTIFASWWDPGHAFTALAQRPTVADGSQNHNHVHDLALMFTLNNSGDVTLALDLMKKYNISYFYTSSDLIGKYGAISFLGTGMAEGYDTLSFDKTQVAQAANGDLLIPYPFDVPTERGTVPTSILLSLKNNATEADAVWKIADQPAKSIQRLYYYTAEGQLKYKETTGNDTIDMALYVFPGYGNAMFLNKHIEQNLLTRLHIFDGEGLEKYFEKVKDFNSEIKVFKVKYD